MTDLRCRRRPPILKEAMNPRRWRSIVNNPPRLPDLSRWERVQEDVAGRTDRNGETKKDAPGDCRRYGLLKLPTERGRGHRVENAELKRERELEGFRNSPPSFLPSLVPVWDFLAGQRERGEEEVHFCCSQSAFVKREK